MPFCDVLLPGPWWNSLTYETPVPAEPGARVIVPVGRGVRIGVVESARETPPDDRSFSLRSIREFPDEGALLPPDMLDLLLWGGRTFLCGAGVMLTVVLPPQFLADRAPLPPFSQPVAPSQREYEETFLYDCDDEARWGQLRGILERRSSFIALFPEQALAKAFWKDLPASLKEKSILWPSTGGKKLRDAWLSVRQGTVAGVVGGPGAVFAPLPEGGTIVVDEESSRAHSAYKWPHVHSRTIAGRRARVGGAHLVLSGRLPSSRIALRDDVVSRDRPARNDIRFVDIRKGFASESLGISGSLSLSKALFDETRACMDAKRVSLWILDRKGYAGEVACEECGSAVLCSQCGSVMAWEEKKNRLRCSACGAVRPFPEVCPACRGPLLTGKRPGLEALYAIAQTLASDACPAVFWEDERPTGEKKRRELAGKMSSGGIVVGTRGTLAACDSVDVGFVAWVDADAEARNVAFQAKFTAFSMIWESLWRGRGAKDRVLLLQSRRPGSGWQRGVALGWPHFWRDELEERREFGLPPFSFLLGIRCPSLEAKRGIMARLEQTAIAPMDPDETALSFWATVPSMDRIRRALAPFFSIGNSGRGFPEITVWID